MNLKRILLLFALVLPLAAAGRPADKPVSKAKITAVISEFRRYDGVEVVRLGRVATAAIKGVMRASTHDDPEAREALALMRRIKRFEVFEYDDCAPEVRERIARRLDDALSGSDLLMEAKDGGSSMRMFGVLDEKTDQVRDFVIHSPENGALICLFGSIPLDAVGKMMADD